MADKQSSSDNVSTSAPTSSGDTTGGPSSRPHTGEGCAAQSAHGAFETSRQDQGGSNGSSTPSFVDQVRALGANAMRDRSLDPYIVQVGAELESDNISFPTKEL